MSAPTSRTPSVSDSVDEENMQQLGTAMPVTELHLLHSPAETKEWVTLKEGYLLKTKVKKLHKSTKLRLFLLKQNPTNLASQLEYYEGFSLRGAASLVNARIQPQKGGVFLVNTSNRTFYLQAEKGDLKIATSWVIALQQAICSASGSRTASMVSEKGSDDPPTATPPSPGISSLSLLLFAVFFFRFSPFELILLGKKSAQKEEMEAFSCAIDEARWAALRKVMGGKTAAVPSIEDDEVRLLRQAEVAEEMRQEAERAAWLAKRVVPMATLVEEDEEEEEERSPVRGDGGESSADEDMESEIRLMRLAEEEEETRQKAERLEFLASRQQSG
jgi:hypothetical protein